MSTARGGGHKGGQKYQNTFAFKHNKNSKKTAKILSIQHSGLCTRCDEKIEWRKKFRKYKPITAPKKCKLCLQPTVSRAYHSLCNDCGNKKSVCCMCLTPREENEELDEELKSARRANAREVKAYLASLRERERRRITRLQENELVRFYIKEDGSLLVKELEPVKQEEDANDEGGDEAEGTEEEGSLKVPEEEEEDDDDDVEDEDDDDDEEENENEGEDLAEEEQNDDVDVEGEIAEDVETEEVDAQLATETEKLGLEQSDSKDEPKTVRFAEDEPESSRSTEN